MAKASGGTRVRAISNPNGQAGRYTVYRIGGNRTDSGMIFTSPSFEYSDHYGAREFYKGQETLEYKVDIQNPFVVELERDVFRENTYFTDEAYRKLVKGRPSSNQLSNDRAIASALKASGYDALMYRGKDGRILEIAILPEMLGAGKKTRNSTVWSRVWGQTREEFIKDMTAEYISWGNNPNDAKKFAVEEADRQEKQWKNRL